MAEITFTGASDQLLQVRGEAFSPLDTVDNGARVRVKRFTYTALGVVAVTTGYVELFDLPSGAVVLGTTLNAVALTGTAKVSVGYSPKGANTDTDKAALLAATAAAVASLPAKTNVAVGEGVVTVALNVTTAALAADDTVSGFVTYVENT
jgi:hypothetical protein